MSRKHYPQNGIDRYWTACGQYITEMFVGGRFKPRKAPLAIATKVRAVRCFRCRKSIEYRAALARHFDREEADGIS